MRGHGERRALALLVAWALVGASIAAATAAQLPLTSQRLTTYRTCTITATPSTTSVVVDATVRQASPTSNFGTQTTNVVSSASTSNQRTYIRFDLTRCSPTIDASATVRLATLRLYASAIAAVCRTLDIFEVTASWSESTLTWNNQPFGTTLNNPSSGTRTDSLDIGSATGCENATASRYVTGADVTTDVAGWAAGTATNYGWMLRDDVEGSSTTRTTTTSAKNLGTLAQAPQLVITYVVVP